MMFVFWSPTGLELVVGPICVWRLRVERRWREQTAAERSGREGSAAVVRRLYQHLGSKVSRCFDTVSMIAFRCQIFCGGYKPYVQTASFLEISKLFQGIFWPALSSTVLSSRALMQKILDNGYVQHEDYRYFLLSFATELCYSIVTWRRSDRVILVSLIPCTRHLSLYSFTLMAKA